MNVLVTFLVISITQTVNAFTDVNTTTQYRTAINFLQTENVVEGYSDGSFKPSTTINRAEFLTIIHRANPFNLNKKLYSNCFPDVTDQWFADTVCRAEAEGIISGYPDGTFKPEQTITFAEASKILALAYKQEPEQYQLWYKGYIEALDANNAVPTSIKNLEQPITRAEMAELIWRITENKTDEPSTNYYNIKYPEAAVNFSSSTVQYAKTCTDLEIFTQELQENSNAQNFYYEDSIAMPMAIPAPAMRLNTVTNKVTQESMAVSDGDFSETNVQVSGVDEADIVKTDGTYIYALQNNVLSITKAIPANNMEVVAEYALRSDESSNFYASEFYIHNNTIVVLGSHTKQFPINALKQPSPVMGKRIAPGYLPPYHYMQQAQVRLFSFTESTGITEKRTISFEGSTVSSRVINNTLYFITNKGFAWNYPMPLLREGTSEVQENTVPLFSDTATNQELEPVVRCDQIAILPRVKQPQYLTVSTIALDSFTEPVQKEVIVGNGDNVYMSINNLYVASTEHNYGWGRAVNFDQTTTVHRFTLTEDSVAYKASGSVPGRILNQFSMDEYNQSFRIATTIDQNWQTEAPSLNNLYSLNLDLDITGSVEDIAPGERIYSVRFMGDRTYMVTFKKVDPFFVIDTSDPRNPTILGQLKLPGYSDYLHPYDRNHVIGFGKDAVAAKDADFAWYQGMKVALFNVQDVTNPTLQASLTIGDRGTDSPLLTNHKALLFDKERNLLAFPIQIHELTAEQKQKNDDGNAYGEAMFQGAIVLNISPSGISELGRITHYTKEDFTKLGSYFYGKNIERILRIGEHLFTLGQDGIHSSTIDTVAPVDAVEFTKQDEPEYRIMY